ncbi:MAG: pyruvoyl-dependent arginine decarboxylase [Candidatus Nanoarchaeia archaeon]|nr:pyruvoyl-dependent arginine decarboxylase [Candidatus Nanoarchaeia archaeon]
MKNPQSVILLQKYVSCANRIPKDFFITKGSGESDITIHAGSYHLALKDAGIEKCNIITYSSILPAVANEIEKPEVITHGEVMESIMAVANSNSGERATAGIILGWLYNKNTGEKYGGLVCEHNGNYTEEEIKEKLKLSINELYTNGYCERYELKDIKIIKESFIPKKKYGTAIVSLCFTNHLYPIISG